MNTTNTQNVPANETATVLAAAVTAGLEGRGVHRSNVKQHADGLTFTVVSHLLNVGGLKDAVKRYIPGAVIIDSDTNRTRNNRRISAWVRFTVILPAHPARQSTDCAYM